jgi:hypothetical protein
MNLLLDLFSIQLLVNNDVLRKLNDELTRAHTIDEG